MLRFQRCTCGENDGCSDCGKSVGEKIPAIICRIIGHKFSQVELLIFEIKNNPVNVKNKGSYSTITCPRCRELFDPSA